MDMPTYDPKDIRKAILVGIQLPQVSTQEFNDSLTELTRLITTLGHEVIGQISQKASSTKKSTLLGEGKLKELAQMTGGTGVVESLVDHIKSKAQLKWEAESEEILETEPESPIEGLANLVVVDAELSPSQLRNLESATGVPVLDRTGVIIEIFSRHARTKVARLQVEIAKLTYVAPRLRETGGGADRQGGGIGSKGSGETKLELDRRKIRDRIKALKDEVAAMGDQDHVRRERRKNEITVALVGYTNAGKSSLMRALTGSEVLVADKLFATLDTTIRPLHPETMPRVLISDTVGFIKKLPHDLVASFKSTLDEALYASLLLFVVDCSDPSFKSQLEVTFKVLDEVGATETPRLLILNKRDQLSEDDYKRIQSEYPEGIFISTRDPKDIAKMREIILSHFEGDMIDGEIYVPYSAKSLVGEIRSSVRVLEEKHSESGTTYFVRGSEKRIGQLIEMADSEDK